MVQLPFRGEESDRGVSPVIGVILMVAITVILAAVIASFVLGLGDQTDEVTPNINFNAETTDGNFTISVETSDGEGVADDFILQFDPDQVGSADALNNTNTADDVPLTQFGSGGFDGTINAGDSATDGLTDVSSGGGETVDVELIFRGDN